MFSRTQRNSAQTQTALHRLSRWGRWVDRCFNAALVGGVLFMFGGGYESLAGWMASHALIDLAGPADVAVKQTPLTDYDKAQLNCLAVNVWHEAANQGEDGMRAVAAVTVNRLVSGRFGRDLCSVVTAHWRTITRGTNGHVASYRTHWEFSWQGEPHATPSGPTWRQAQLIARKTYLAGDQEYDLSHGAKYYLNPRLTEVRRDPNAISAVVNDHVFYSY